MSLRFKVVIPARYGSTRLPGKPLLTIAGKPMIAHVCERALEAGADDIIVATDNEKIKDTVCALGIKAVMTNPNHQSGTERIAEVVKHCGWGDNDIIVNLQGDEPLILPITIREVASALANQQLAGIATLAAKILDPEEIFNPNAVKVVVNKMGYALYFSRAPIPWERDAFADAGILGNGNQYSGLRADAGLGTTLAINFGKYNKLQPLVLRFDVPFFLNRVETGANYVAFRYVVGINRAF